MPALDALRSRFRSWLGSRPATADIDEELLAHIQLRADDLERSGLPRAEAERRARIEFGGYQKYREDTHEALAAIWSTVFLHDLRLRFVSFANRLASPSPPLSPSPSPSAPTQSSSAFSTRLILRPSMCPSRRISGASSISNPIPITATCATATVHSRASPPGKWSSPPSIPATIRLGPPVMRSAATTSTSSAFNPAGAASSTPPTSTAPTARPMWSFPGLLALPFPR